MLPTEFRDRRETINQGEEDAAAVIRKFWAQDIPVDPVIVASNLGVAVFENWLPGSDIFGALRRKKGRQPQILVESSDPPVRKRFTCAHELGHFWRYRGQSDIDRLDLRSDISSQGTDLEEVYANTFAANLLMPPAAIRREWEKLANLDGDTKLTVMAGRFGVSKDAMGYRLTNLGISRD